MGLVERIDNRTLPAHEFGAALHLLAIGKVSVTDVENLFQMDAADKADLALLSAAAQTSGEGAVLYAKRVESVMALMQHRLTGQVVTAQAARGLLDI